MARTVSRPTPRKKILHKFIWTVKKFYFEWLSKIERGGAAPGEEGSRPTFLPTPTFKPVIWIIKIGALIIFFSLSIRIIGLNLGVGKNLEFLTSFRHIAWHEVENQKSLNHSNSSGLTPMMAKISNCWRIFVTKAAFTRSFYFVIQWVKSMSGSRCKQQGTGDKTVTL